MSTITLVSGDFGTGDPVRFDSDDFFLPDPLHPGVSMPLPLVEVSEMEAVEDDRSGQVRQALKLRARGFGAAGPVGLAMGVFAATRVKDLTFRVRFQDGRQFLATTDAATYADLHAAQISARLTVFTEGGRTAADSLIAKYLDARDSIPRPAPRAPVQPASPAKPTVSEAPAAAEPARPEPPVFGRRRG